MAITIETKRCVISSDTHGNVTTVGVVDDETEVPSTLQTYSQPVLNDGEGNYYALASATALALKSSGDITTLAAGEPRRRAVSQLSDEQLTVLGISREAP